MQKIIGLLAVGVVIIVGAFWWHKKSQMSAPPLVKPASESEAAHPLSVVATFYPLEALAQSVGGERIVVKSIVPAGAEPHDYEPTAQDMVAVYGADVFLLNGAGVDAWAEKIRPDLEARGITVVVMAELMPLLPGTPEAGAGANHNQTADTDAAFDPHFWLDPTLAEKEVEAIRDALIARDPTGAGVYAENSRLALEQLGRLDEAYREGLSSCALHTIVTSHNAFSYMAKRYGFSTLALSGLSPEAEPSPRRLAEIIALVKEQGIRYVFTETLLSPKVAETLAREAGISTLVFNPIEGLTNEERARGENYQSIMQENLAQLQTALVCQK